MEVFPVHFPTLGCFTQFYHLHSSYYYLPSSWLSFGSSPRQQTPQGSDCHTEESKSEKGKQILYINAYTWTLKKPVWSYLQSRNRDTDIENKFMGAKGEGDGMNWEMGINTYTLLILCIQWVTHEHLWYSTGKSIENLWYKPPRIYDIAQSTIQCSVVTKMRRKSNKEGIYINM